MTSEAMRTKLQAILSRIPEQEDDVRDAKREIFALFKEMKKPEVVKEIDRAAVRRLQAEVERLKGDLERLQREVRRLDAMEQRLRGEVQRLQEEVKRLHREVYRAAGRCIVAGMLTTLSSTNANDESIRRGFGGGCNLFSSVFSLPMPEAIRCFVGVVKEELKQFAEQTIGTESFVAMGFNILESDHVIV